ncbi:hypothetical protein DRO60_02820 [Candidatus Bathyarchaeota archaeon]|nr:MAG: hypothetical protein DRO60_02820 [Candidatus Bathyarchaeota archaeon]
MPYSAQMAFASGSSRCLRPSSYAFFISSDALPPAKVEHRDKLAGYLITFMPSGGWQSPRLLSTPGVAYQVVVGVSVAERKFMAELSSLLDSMVSVRTVDGRTITGRLMGFRPESMSICLWDARVEGTDTRIPKLFLNGSIIAEIWSMEKPFDLRGLADRIAGVFGYEHVKLAEEQGVIIVLGRVKVTKDGVVGTGPVAEKVRKIYESFIKDMERAGERAER